MQSRDLELDPSTEPSRRADGSSRRRRIVLTCAAVLAFPAAMGTLASLTRPLSADPPPKAPPASAAPSRVPAPAGPTRVPAPPVSSVAAPAKRPTGYSIPQQTPQPYGGPLADLLLDESELPPHFVTFPDCCFYGSMPPAFDNSCKERVARPASQTGRTAERNRGFHVTKPRDSSNLDGRQVLVTYSSPSAAAAAVAAYRDFLSRCRVLAIPNEPPFPDSHQPPLPDSQRVVEEVAEIGIGDEGVRSTTLLEFRDPEYRGVSHLSMARSGNTLQLIDLGRELAPGQSLQTHKKQDLLLLEELAKRGLAKLTKAAR